MTVKNDVKERERELFILAHERIERETHYMAADVPYWVEDFLECGVGILRAMCRSARLYAILAAVALAIYEIYAILNGLPRVSFHGAIQWVLSGIVTGGLIGPVIFAFRGVPR